MWLSFGPAGRPVGVDVYRRGMRPDDVRTVSSDVFAASPIQTARLQHLSARM